MKDTIMEMPDYQRPYEKCLREGEQSLSDRELLAVILRCGVQGSSSLTLADKILNLSKQTGYSGLLGLFHISMQELMKRVGNRYLLVNLAAQRARDIADEAEQSGVPLTDKAVKLALDEIAAGEIVYRPGPRVEPIKTANNPIAAAMVDVDDDLDDEERASDSDEENEDGETTVSRRRMDEFDDEELDDGDIPEEDR